MIGTKNKLSNVQNIRLQLYARGESFS